MPGIVAFVPQKFIVHPDAVHLIEDNTISVKDVFAGAEWFPTATPAAQFGFLPLIAGTLWVSLFAILFALPFGLSVSIYMSEVANPKVRSWLKPIIELLSGIPSVVYGFFGLIVIVPLIQKLFDLPVGEGIGRKYRAGYYGIAHHNYGDGGCDEKLVRVLCGRRVWH